MLEKQNHLGSGVRNYSNNTRRIVRGPIQNITTTIQTTKHGDTKRKVYEKLNNWVGDQVLYKDSNGEYIWGLLKSVNIDSQGKLVKDTVDGLNIEIEEITEPEPGII